MNGHQALAEFRHRIRVFLAFSEQAAREIKIEPQQHQLLLAVKGLPPGLRPTISTIAERLVLRHHTVVELADRLEKRQLLRRERSPRDAREIILSLTPAGSAILSRLSASHRRELEKAAPALISALEAVVAEAGAAPRRPRRASSRPGAKTHEAERGAAASAGGRP
jgi:DNA-binding MarR family transcriptional regulator